MPTRINKIKHIALISTSFPETSDGSEAAGSFVYDFALELSKHCKVTVIAPSKKSGQISISDSFATHLFKVPFLPLSILKPLNPKYWWAIISTLNNGLSAVNECVQADKPDYLFALWSLPSGYWAKVIGRKYKIPYATWSLGSDIWSLGKVPIIRSVLKKVLQQSQINFADGYLLASDVEKISSKSCTFLPSTRKLTINKNKQLKEKGPYNLAFLGRWHPNKGIDLLLQSLELLPEDAWKNIHEIRICGGGPLENRVKDEVNFLIEQGHPLYLGSYLSKEQAVELFQWADYVIIPSRIESIPVVFSDAMKCLCPVVTMPVGDLPALISKYKVGNMANNVTAQSFSNALEKILLQDPNSFSSGLKLASNDFKIENISLNLLDKIFPVTK